MGDLMLKCPLCCNKTFDSKISLIVHLANILSNLTCPICDNKWSSLGQLIEHLNLDECQPEYIIETLEENNDDSVDASVSQNQCENVTDNIKTDEYETQISSDSDQISKEFNDNALNDGKMYMTLLDDKSKGCLQTQELKLVCPDGQMEQFVFMSQGGTGLGLENAVVTKQNNDGTISLTAVEDLKTKSETVIAPSESEVVDTEELYSCNTCGVSFTSVIEHIQNYHNDQEVVVEEPVDEEDNGLVTPIQYDTHTTEEPTDKQEAPRRVITDTGDIVEASLIINSLESNEVIVPTMLKDMPKAEKQNRIQSKRFVQIDEFCESMVKNIKGDVDEKDGPYHKVIVKEVQAIGGNKVKSYYCMSCNIYVTNLKDFKLHPCKILKYPCPHCPVAYENSKSLCGHMKVHKQAQKVKPDEVNTNLPVTYECGICNTVFLTNKSLKLHKRMHDPIKSRPIEPPVENSDGTETSSDKYKCSVCDKLIPLDYRAIHQNSHDSNELNCAICNRKFHSSEYLEMHMNVHNLDKVPVNKSYKSLPYSCLYCNRRFARPHEKVKHERIHTGEKPHSCEICGKSFRVSYCLTLHMRTHTGARPYCCKHCGKRFKAHSVYNHHLLTHSEVRAYKCPYCPKAFKTSVQLAGHKNSHTKPFSCQHCNRPFASLYAVRVHTETHLRQNNLKFACALCGASYARAFALKDHVRQAHRQHPDALEGPMLKTKDDWTIKEDVADVESEAVVTLNSKELSPVITQLELTSNELIIP